MSTLATRLPITTRVVAVAQNKGSVGKSTISLCLIDLWLRLGLPIQVIDGDSDHNTLKYAYEEEPWVERIDLLGSDARRNLLGFLAPANQQPLVLIDLPANSSSRFWAQLQLGCIRSNNLDLIDLALTRIFEQEGCRRIPKPPQTMPSEGLRHNPWLLLCDLWIVGLFIGTSEWTFVKTQPNELLCRRAIGANRPRLSELAIQIGHNAFHLGTYGS